MIEYIPVILICSFSFPPSECKEGKRDVTIVVGEIKNTPMNCVQEGYEHLARLAFAPRQGDNHYAKVKCVPKITTEFGR